MLGLDAKMDVDAVSLISAVSSTSLLLFLLLFFLFLFVLTFPAVELDPK